MRGPNSDRDLFLTGNLTFDVMPPRQGRPRRVTPFLVAGGGFFQHSDSVGRFDFTSYEGAFTAGGGVRGWITDRVYALADVRFGWELHARMNGGIGIDWDAEETPEVQLLRLRATKFTRASARPRRSLSLARTATSRGGQLPGPRA